MYTTVVFYHDPSLPKFRGDDTDYYGTLYLVRTLLESSSKKQSGEEVFATLVRARDYIAESPVVRNDKERESLWDALMPVLFQGNYKRLDKMKQDGMFG